MLEEKLLPALVSWCESLCVYLITCVYWCASLWACAFDCVCLHLLIIMKISDAAHLLVSLHTVHTCITTQTHTRAHTKASMHTLDMMVIAWWQYVSDMGRWLEALFTCVTKCICKLCLCCCTLCVFLSVLFRVWTSFNLLRMCYVLLFGQH